MKCKYVKNELLNFTNEDSQDRKRSVQSYHKPEGGKIAQYISEANESYKGKGGDTTLFSKRDHKSTSCSRSKIISCRTPNTTTGVKEYQTNESMVLTTTNPRGTSSTIKGYDMPSKRVKKEPAGQSGTLIDF